MTGSTDNEVLGLRTSVAASPDQVSCDVDSERVILSLSTGEYYGLNPVAADIWELVQDRRTVLDIRDALLSMYDGISDEDCTYQLLGTLREMRELRLIHTFPAGSAENDDA